MIMTPRQAKLLRCSPAAGGIKEDAAGGTREDASKTPEPLSVPPSRTLKKGPSLVNLRQLAQEGLSPASKGDAGQYLTRESEYC